MKKALTLGLLMLSGASFANSAALGLKVKMDTSIYQVYQINGKQGNVVEASLVTTMNDIKSMDLSIFFNENGEVESQSFHVENQRSFENPKGQESEMIYIDFDSKKLRTIEVNKDGQVEDQTIKFKETSNGLKIKKKHMRKALGLKLRGSVKDSAGIEISADENHVGVKVKMDFDHSDYKCEVFQNRTINNHFINAGLVCQMDVQVHNMELGVTASTIE